MSVGETASHVAAGKSRMEFAAGRAVHLQGISQRINTNGMAGELERMITTVTAMRERCSPDEMFRVRVAIKDDIGAAIGSFAAAGVNESSNRDARRASQSAQSASYAEDRMHESAGHIEASYYEALQALHVALDKIKRLGSDAAYIHNDSGLVAERCYESAESAAKYMDYLQAGQ